MKNHTMILAAFTAMLLTVTASAEEHQIVITEYDPAGSITPATQNNDNDDDGPAFEAALKEIAANNGGTLLVPAGNYHFSSGVKVNLKNPDNGAVNVTILGDGRGVSQIHSRTTEELFYFNNTPTTSQLGVHDISFLADYFTEPLESEYESSSTGSGGAIRFKNSELCDNTPENANIHSLSMSAVNFQAEDWRATEPTKWFRFGVFASSVHQPVFDDVNFSNRLKRAFEGAGVEEPLYLGEAGFKIINGRGASFKSCYSKQVTCGIGLYEMSGDISLQRVIATGGDYGLYFTSANSTNCTVTVLDSQWNHSIYGMFVLGADKVTVTSLAGYNHCDYSIDNGGYWDSSYSDIYVRDCEELVVTNSIFTTYHNEFRTNIEIHSTPTVTVKNNIFNSNPPATKRPFDIPATAVSLRGKVVYPRIVDSIVVDPDPKVLGPTDIITHNIYNKVAR